MRKEWYCKNLLLNSLPPIIPVSIPKPWLHQSALTPRNFCNSFIALIWHSSSEMFSFWLRYLLTCAPEPLQSQHELGSGCFSPKSNHSGMGRTILWKKNQIALCNRLKRQETENRTIFCILQNSTESFRTNKRTQTRKGQNQRAVWGVPQTSKTLGFHMGWLTY